MKLPKLCRHPASDQAYVRVNRKVKYSGKWDAPETEAAYDAWLLDYVKGQQEIITEGISAAAPQCFGLLAFDDQSPPAVFLLRRKPLQHQVMPC